MYFTKDSESMKDFDDEVDSDWDWDESDSSMDLSQFNDDEDDNNMGESAKVADVCHTYMDNSGGVGEEGQQERTSSGLSRQHASAPCLLNMTYEVPLKDDDKGKGSSPPNNRRPSRKERNNPHILSFHG